jgi:hypothetical protein
MEVPEIGTVMAEFNATFKELKKNLLQRQEKQNKTSQQ